MRFTSDITVELIHHVGGDRDVIGAMQVSTKGNDASETVERMSEEAVAGRIRYLMRHRHGTPFEHNSMTFRVHAPIFVFREWQRHRIGWSYNEESGRYKELEPVFWVPHRDRPMIPAPAFSAARPSFEIADDDEFGCVEYDTRLAYQVAWDCYQSMLNRGIGREVARCVLPVGIYSSMWATCNARSLMHLLSLRTHDPDAAFVSYPLREFEEAARMMELRFAARFPLTHAAFVEMRRVAP